MRGVADDGIRCIGSNGPVSIVPAHHKEDIDMKRNGLKAEFLIGMVCVISIAILGATAHAGNGYETFVVPEDQCSSISGPSAGPGSRTAEASGALLILAGNCAPDGSPCSDPNNPKQTYPACSKDCCSGQYHDCDGIACICGPRR